MQVGDYAQQDERLGAGVEDAVAVTLGAVVAHARTEGILLAIVETDALAGEHTGEAQKKLSNRIPCSAILSRLGV